MKPAQRWPLHPAPREGEAPSSWLNRIAACYQMGLHDLLEHDLGHSQVDDSVPAALETYAFQFSILLPRRNRETRSIKSWRAWLPSQPFHRGCPLCLNDPANQAVLLAWKVPLMLSCPVHDCPLESYWGIPGQYLGWNNSDAAPRTASKAIVAMDQRTWQALTTAM